MILSKTLKYVVLSGLQSVKRPHFHPKNSDEKFETLENFFKTSNVAKIPLDEIFIAPNGISATNHEMSHRLVQNLYNMFKMLHFRRHFHQKKKKKKIVSYLFY
jgi:hypothetical protein